ncbi:MAG: hypothetical protein LBH09_07985 [Peptococcaceae bacterium]|nr:hypothetical protein [Peptococcaceae bacterium]
MPSLEERQREMSEYLKDDAERIFSERTSQTMERLHTHKAEILQSLIDAMRSSSALVQPIIASGRKQKVKYLQFSFLLSGVLTRELRLKMDFLDARYYADITDSGGYWDYSALLPFVDEDMEILRNKLLKQFRRVMEYELSDIRMVYCVGLFAIMEMALTELVAETAFAEALAEVFEPEVFVLYGAYHDQAKLIATIAGR